MDCETNTLLFGEGDMMGQPRQKNDFFVVKLQMQDHISLLQRNKQN